jgi:hypothetical protein
VKPETISLSYDTVLEESLSSEAEFLQPARAPSVPLYTVHNKNSSCLFVTFSLFTTQCTCKTCILSTDFGREGRRGEVPVSWPATSPDLNNLILLCGSIIKSRSAPVQSILERKCGFQLNNLELKYRIKIFDGLRVPFSRRMNLSASVETISSDYCKKLRTKSSSDS